MVIDTEINNEKRIRREQAIVGCLWGTAVGDALGLPCEGLTKRRQRRLFPDMSRYHLLPGRGMVSDDTEHTWMVAQALCLAKGDPTKFGVSLASQLRVWLLLIPAGIGFATLRATLRLCLGWSFTRSGVYSAGNGPAMRSALIGVCYGQDPPLMETLVRVSARITHTDAKAEYGALAIAAAAWIATSELSAASPPTSLDQPSGLKTSGSADAENRMWHNTSRQWRVDSCCAQILQVLPQEAEEFAALLERVRTSVLADETTEVFADSLGAGQAISGYVYQTVPVVLHAWLRSPRDYEQAVLGVIRCGGDTDTTAAIVGALVGAAVGKEGIRPEWRNRLCEWPRTPARMEQLGVCLNRSLTAYIADGSSDTNPKLSYAIPFLNPFALLVRNFLFLIVILMHGLRRLLPPY